MDTDHTAQDGKSVEPKDKKQSNRDKRSETKEKKEWRFRWAVQVFFISVALSAVLSFCSSEALEGAELGLAFGVLAGGAVGAEDGQRRPGGSGLRPGGYQEADAPLRGGPHAEAVKVCPLMRRDGLFVC